MILTALLRLLRQGNQNADHGATKDLMSGRPQERNKTTHKAPGIRGVLRGGGLLASVLAVHCPARLSGLRVRQRFVPPPHHYCVSTPLHRMVIPLGRPPESFPEPLARVTRHRPLHTRRRSQ